MKTQEELVADARAAGVAGIDWGTWTAGDAVQDAIWENNPHDDAIVEAWEAAFAEGVVERRRAAGWVERWTTAPVDYDTFGTMTLENAGPWKNREVRRVLMDPDHHGYQIDRYASGLHGTWVVDPREEERRFAEMLETQRLQTEARARERAAALEALPGMSDDDIEDAIDADKLPPGIDYADLRIEKKRRRDEAAAAEREQAYRAALEVVPIGSTLLDDGAPATQGRWGRIPGRPPAIYPNVSLDGGYSRDVSVASVVSGNGEQLGSLEYVADWIRTGRLRIAEGPVPPAAVIKRVGRERWKEIARVEVDDMVVWVARPPFGGELLVLDDRGHLVRRAAVRAKAAALSGK